MWEWSIYFEISWFFCCVESERRVFFSDSFFERQPPVPERRGEANPLGPVAVGSGGCSFKKLSEKTSRLSRFSNKKHDLSKKKCPIFHCFLKQREKKKTSLCWKKFFGRILVQNTHFSLKKRVSKGAWLSNLWCPYNFWEYMYHFESTCFNFKNYFNFFWK